MDTTVTAALGFVALMIALALRMPVGLAMLVVGSAGYASLSSLPALLNYLKTTPYYLFANYTLSVIPLFVLMGTLAEQSGVSAGLFAASRRLLGRRSNDGLAVIWAATLFSSICGSSVATTATFGRAVLPQLRQSYADAGCAAALIAVSGGMGILIPPSVILLIYAISTEQNIVRLFQAAVVPGLCAALFYSLTLWLVSPAAGDRTAQEAGASSSSPVPVLVIALVVIGGIYGGLFTPTEAAAIGVILMLVSGLVTRTLSKEGVITAIVQGSQTTAMIFMIFLGSEVFNAFLGLSQLPVALSQMVSSWHLSPSVVMGLILLSYLLLGAVMDEIAMILLTLPVYFPLVMGLDFGMSPEDTAIWFGILVLIVVGIGLIAPPIGLNVFVVSSIAREIPVNAIYRHVLPFVIADLLRLGLVMLCPSVALALMHWMK